VDREERFWPTRVRWRLRGAWMWPTFGAITLLDGLIMWRLPPVGGGVDLIPAILISTFGNLVIIAVVAPWLARRTWRRRPAAEPGAPPRAQLEVLIDRMGTALLVATVVGVVAAGLAARPTVVSETRESERNANAFRSFILKRGDGELIRNLETANTIELGDALFRTCVARDDRQHYFCTFIDASKDPAHVDVDPSGEPNSVYKR
jgi:hypothetical protein